MDSSDDVFEGVGSSPPASLPRKPDPWALLWLQKNREDLVTRLQGLVPRLLDTLVQRGLIDPLQSAYQVMMCPHTVPANQARRLLDWLLSQPMKIFNAFQEALQKESGVIQSSRSSLSDRSFFVSEVEKKELASQANLLSTADRLCLGCQPSVKKARDELRKSYAARTQLMMRAGVTKGKQMDIERIVVGVCLISSENVEKAFEESARSCSNPDEEDSHAGASMYKKVIDTRASLLKLENVFKAEGEDEDGPDKVLASGGVGCGKSVCFSRTALYHWSLGSLWPNFVLLFCISLADKSVWQARTLPELLRLERLGLNEVEQEEVRQFITENPAEVVVVCDGLDEGQVVEGSLLWQTLNGDSVGVPQSLRIVVTTRPCRASRVLSRSCSYRGVEVTGFTQEGVEEFARKYLGKEQGRKFLTMVKKQPELSELMRAPFFSLLLGELFKKDGSIPVRQTDIFEKILVAVLQRFAEKRQLSDHDEFSSVSCAPGVLQGLTTALAKLAFAQMRTDRAYFTEADLQEVTDNEDMLKLGLLTKSDSPTRYAFRHRAVQEFLSAFHVAKSGERGKLEMEDLLQRVGDSRLSSFWVFLAGLLQGDQVEHLMEYLTAALIAPGGISAGRGLLSQLARGLLYLCIHECQGTVLSPSVKNYLQFLWRDARRPMPLILGMLSDKGSDAALPEKCYNRHTT